MQQIETPALEIGGGPEPLARLLSNATRRRLETAVVAAWLKARRWYAAKDADAPEVAILDILPLDEGGGTGLTMPRATPPGQSAQHYLLPLALLAEAPAEATLARARVGGDPHGLASNAARGRAGAARRALRRRHGSSSTRLRSVRS